MTDKDAEPGQDGAGSGTVRDDVLAAFKEHGAPVEETFSLDPAPAKEEPAPEGETTEEKADRQRNERGQFAKGTDAPAKDTPEKADSRDKTTDQDNTEKATAQASTPAGEPPKGWSAEARADWSKLSPATQTAVLKREQEISDGGRQWSEEKRRYEEMITPLRESASKRGIDEREGLKRLLAAQNALETNPGNALRWLAKSYGVDLQQLATNPGYQAQPVVPRTQSPDIATVIEQKLEEREARRSVESIARDTQNFPHFEKVRSVMAVLVESGEAETLEDAYDMACNARKDIREQLLSAQQSNAAEEKRQAEQQRVDKAKKASVSLRGSAAGVPSTPAKQFDDVHSAVVDAWRQHTGT